MEAVKKMHAICLLNRDSISLKKNPIRQHVCVSIDFLNDFNQLSGIKESHIIIHDKLSNPDQAYTVR